MVSTPGGRRRPQVAAVASALVMAITLPSCGQVGDGIGHGSSYRAGGPTRVVVDGDRLLSVSDLGNEVTVTEWASGRLNERVRQPIDGHVQSLGAVVAPGASRLDVLVNQCLSDEVTDTDGDQSCDGETALNRITVDTKRWKVTRTTDLSHLGVRWGADLRGGLLGGVPMIRSVGAGGFLLKPDTEVALPDSCPVGSTLYAAGGTPTGAVSYGPDVASVPAEPQLVRRFDADGRELAPIPAPVVAADEVATGLTVSCSSDALYLQRSIADPAEGHSRFQSDVLQGETWRTALTASVGSFAPNEYTDPAVVIKVRDKPGDNSTVDLVALEGGRTAGRVGTDDSEFSSYRVISVQGREYALVGTNADLEFRIEDAP